MEISCTSEHDRCQRIGLVKLEKEKERVEFSKFRVKCAVLLLLSLYGIIRSFSFNFWRNGCECIMYNVQQEGQIPRALHVYKRRY